jgi:hypothetical protein
MPSGRAENALGTRSGSNHNQPHALQICFANFGSTRPVKAAGARLTAMSAEEQGQKFQSQNDRWP